MKRTLCFALGTLAGCLLVTGCTQPQKPAAEDPRMAGFKGKIAKKYEDSKEDWPLRPQAPTGPS